MTVTPDGLVQWRAATPGVEHAIARLTDASGNSTFHTFAVQVTSNEAVLADVAGIRTWTDSSGSHKVQARFVKIENAIVYFIREDGRPAAVPLERLSGADQIIARKLAAAADSE
jgi:hypothetical protein